MAQESLNDEALARIQKLIEANYSGSDELQAAAESLGQELRQHVCGRGVLLPK